MAPWNQKWERRIVNYFFSQDCERNMFTTNFPSSDSMASGGQSFLRPFGWVVVGVCDQTYALGGKRVA